MCSQRCKRREGCPASRERGPRGLPRPRCSVPGRVPARVAGAAPTLGYRSARLPRVRRQPSDNVRGRQAGARGWLVEVPALASGRARPSRWTGLSFCHQHGTHKRRCPAADRLCRVLGRGQVGTRNARQCGRRREVNGIVFSHTRLRPPERLTRSA